MPNSHSNSKGNFFVTSPIYYVNDVPHIGHAYTSLACDILARFKRLDGYNTRFLTGTDEHGQKVEKSALTKGKTPQEFCDEISLKFRELANFMGYSYDDFIRTTEERHKKCATEFWNRLEKNGWIYKDIYEGWYAVRDEAFYAEDELIDGKAPTGAEVTWHKEESYFFRLSAFEKNLLALFDAVPDFIEPESKRNEVISFVKSGLKDLSISRTSFSWGIPVPEKQKNEELPKIFQELDRRAVGEEQSVSKYASTADQLQQRSQHLKDEGQKHVVYVWLDALTNYISALGFPDDQNSLYQNFWCHTTHSPIHIVGKDILRFHAVYWPAFLMAADLPLPNRVFAHGWWTNEGQKISKSLGNVIDPILEVEWIKSFNISHETAIDYFRYFLMKEVPFGNDGNYSRENLITRVNAELANNIGNLAQRSLSMIFKNCESKIPENKAIDDSGNAILKQAAEIFKTAEESIEKLAFDQTLSLIINFSSEVNKYFNDRAPWSLKKENKIDEMNSVLYVTAQSIKVIAILLLPFIPNSAAKILDILNISQNDRDFSFLNEPLKSGHLINEPKAIFARIEDKITEKK